MTRFGLRKKLKESIFGKRCLKAKWALVCFPYVLLLNTKTMPLMRLQNVGLHWTQEVLDDLEQTRELLGAGEYSHGPHWSPSYLGQVSLQRPCEIYSRAHLQVAMSTLLCGSVGPTRKLRDLFQAKGITGTMVPYPASASK
jgi:hypothetical protein